MPSMLFHLDLSAYPARIRPLAQQIRDELRCVQEHQRALLERGDLSGFAAVRASLLRLPCRLRSAAGLMGAS